jgi:tRNA(Ile)-lysidine synthase TilS/MesJ
LYNNNLVPELSIVIVDYQISEDEDKAIQKLAEHRDMKLMVKEIGEKHRIEILPTYGNSHRGDFSYPKKNKQNLISILDSYLLEGAENG